MCHILQLAARALPPRRASALKGKAMRRIFGGFCINRFGIGPLHYVSSRSDFGFEFAEIFVIEIRLPDSPRRGVDKIANITVVPGIWSSFVRFIAQVISSYFAAM
jgi:hypothetical protein